MHISRLQLCLILAIALSGCPSRSGEDAGESTSDPIVAVKTAPVTRGSIAVYATATGRVDAVGRERVLAPVAGKLLSLDALEGMFVKRGTVLAVIQPRESQAAISGAETLLRNAHTDSEKSEAERALALARSRANTIEVRARLDGIVSDRKAMTGELVGDNAELLTLIDPASLVFIADLPVKDLTAVRPGQSATVRFPLLNDRTCTATVDAVLAESDAASQTVRVRLRFASIDNALMRQMHPGMTGIARVRTGVHADALLVPAAAVLLDDETGLRTIVFAGDDGRAHVVPVTTGAAMDSMIEIVTGGGAHSVTQGMRVLVEGHYALPDSTRITVR